MSVSCLVVDPSTSAAAAPTAPVPPQPRVRTEVKIVYLPANDNSSTADRVMIVDGKDGLLYSATSSGGSTTNGSNSLTYPRNHHGYRRRMKVVPPRWYVPQTCNRRNNDNTTKSSLDNKNDDFTSVHQLKHSVYKNKSYCNETFGHMAMLRREGVLCDVNLKVCDKVFPVHKVVLAACSPYFRAMFTNEMLERTQSSITLQGIDSEAASLLVDYAYSGELMITEENVQILLPAASLLQIGDIQTACCEFLTKQLHPTNCLGIKKFADTHCCSSLLQAAQSFALKHFATVTETEEFLNLSGNEVIQLITSESLIVSSEDEVYKAVMRWIKYDRTNRETYMTRLLMCVRFPLMTKDSLMQIVQSEPLLRSSHECKDLLIEAMAYHLSPDKRAYASSIRTTERVQKNSKPYLFVLGGSSVFSIQDECECYDPRIEKWAPIPTMMSRRTRIGVATTSKKLYVIGGYDGVKDLSSGEIFDPVKNAWCTLTPMGTKRSCLGVCSLNGLIYASGGYDGSTCLDSVERYDPLANSWTSIQVMNTKRRYHKLVSLDGCLYAIGGFDGTNYLSSVEKYDPKLGKWEAVLSMCHRRSGAGVTTYDGKIYVCGGTDSGVSLSSGEYYTPSKNCWKPIAAMISRRGTHELVEVDGYLFGIGGNDGSISLNTIERYDPRNNSWKMETSMISRRNSVGATAFRCDASIEKLFINKKLKIQSDI